MSGTASYRGSDIIIPILGLTGAGKSTFINTIAGREVATVGHDLQSCTSTVRPIPIPYPSHDDPTRRVIFVDTPGFNDTWVDDTKTLREIVDWLEQSCKQGKKLGGIIYLHEISQTRIGPAKENIDMFHKLCRPSTVKNVILTTTKWGDVPPDVGQEREDELSSQYWSGSDICRFDNTPDSARIIVDRILQKDPDDSLLVREGLVKLVDRLPPKKQASIAGGIFTFLFGKRRS